MTSIPRTADLGDTPINRIGLGTNRLTDTPENRAFLEAAVAAGVNFIDTAHLYTGGQSEATIGATLAPYPDDLVIATKGGFSAEGGVETLRAELEQSFERLATDTIDLYYAHRLHDEIPLEETMGLLKEYCDAGRIRHVGISDVSVEQIERARAVVPIAAVQNEYSQAERGGDDVVDYCTREGILFVPFYPLGGRTARESGGSRREMLAWLLERSPACVPIPGTLSLEHLRENLSALDGAL